ncbi:MAG: hypothetical protein ACP5F8_01005 [Candidatus Aenigmatarchaeota archaeon]
MDEEKKVSWPVIIGVLLGAFFIVILVLSSLNTTSPTTSSSGLQVKVFNNLTLKSGSYFTFNSTIYNPYNISLQNVRVWLYSGSIFTFSNLPLDNYTTIRTFNYLYPKESLSYVFSNIKVESLSTQMKKIPIYLYVLYYLEVPQNFIINAVRNDSLQKYGGKENMGMFYTSLKSPISISFNYDKNNFIYSKGKNEVAKFSIVIRNSVEGEATCKDNLRILMKANDNLSCKILNKTLTGSFEIYYPLSSGFYYNDKIEIPCNYTLSYLNNKEFDSSNFVLRVSCNYLESKKFYFDIVP